MTFLIRLLVSGLGVAVGVIITLAVIYLIVFVVNRGIQWGAENIGGELGNFFKWTWERVPKIKLERKADEEKH